MLPFYIISLSIAAGIVGSFARHVFTQFGYIPGFASGIYVTLGAGFLFASGQLLYLALLRIYQPTRAPGVYATEACSQLATLMLFPAILELPVPGLPDSFARHAPLVYLGVGVAVHLLLKFMSFYAALIGPYDPARPILVWFTLSVLFGFSGVFGFNAWQRSVEAARLTVTSPTVTAAAGNQYARARAMQEGAAVSGSLEPRDKAVMALRFANIEPGLRESDALDRVYVTVTLEGRDSRVFQSSAALHNDRWSEILVPPEFFPANATQYHIYWTRQREPNWQRILGLRPIVYNLPDQPGTASPPPTELYFSGPSIYVQRTPSQTGLSLLVIVVDGLAVDHLSLFGYGREVTPSIDRLGARSHLFPKTRAPGADTLTGITAILTGQDPAALTPSTSQASLPASLSQAGFATAAFFESDTTEQFYNTPMAQAFDLFEERPFPDPALGGADDSSTTLSRVREWVADHRFVPFLCVVRVHAVAQLPPSDAPVDEQFAQDSAARDVDRYDSALLRLDRQLGALFKYIRDYETRSNTAIVLTSTYGLQFSPGAEKRLASAPTDAVPLIIETPERRQLKYPRDVSAHQLAPTMARLAQVRLPGTSSAQSLIP